MSNVSTRHAVRAFISGESAPFSGQRLAKVGYKTTEKMVKEGKKAPPSICASVPLLSGSDVADHMAALMPHILTMLEGVQDNVIRSLYEGRKYQLSDITDDEISVTACLSYLTATTESTRWSKEYIESWFDRVLGDNLTVVIAEKLGFEELNDSQLETVTKHLNGYRGLFGQLAGKTVSLAPAQISGLRRALDVCSVDSESDPITGRVIGKLDEMERIQNGLIEMLL